MKPLEIIDESTTPDGSTIKLVRRDREYIILVNGESLMSSRMHGSEEALATFACHAARSMESPEVLVGGLGMGYTLRATLDLLPGDAAVRVAELLPVVVEWNRGPLGPLAQHPLKDRRVHVDINDVAATLRENPGRFDAVLLDVDNGPTPFTSSGNGQLYNDRGLANAREALKSRGMLAVWSAWDDRKFEKRLQHAGFSVQVERVRARLKKGGPRHTLFLGQKR
jgi:spermidine synthase